MTGEEITQFVLKRAATSYELPIKVGISSKYVPITNTPAAQITVALGKLEVTIASNKR